MSFDGPLITRSVGRGRVNQSVQVGFTIVENNQKKNKKYDTLCIRGDLDCI